MARTSTAAARAAGGRAGKRNWDGAGGGSVNDRVTGRGRPAQAHSARCGQSRAGSGGGPSRRRRRAASKQRGWRGRSRDGSGGFVMAPRRRPQGRQSASGWLRRRCKETSRSAARAAIKKRTQLARPRGGSGGGGRGKETALGGAGGRQEARMMQSVSGWLRRWWYWEGEDVGGRGRPSRSEENAVGLGLGPTASTCPRETRRETAAASG